MIPPLWTLDEIVATTGATPEAAQNGFVTGISIDTRTLQPGDLFVALKDMRDGHEFVTAAFKAGAWAALVKCEYERKPHDGVLLRVADPLVALEKLGIAARARLAPEARVIAVTGSAGKTTTKEMLRTCLEAVAPGQVHASEKSYNNHWGVPLTLARMPADTKYAVFEIGMNHAGEITPLSQMVRPHVAIITTVAPAHLGHFNSVAEIADAKAEIFAGVGPGGVAVLPRDNDHFAGLERAAQGAGAGVISFGTSELSDCRLLQTTLDPSGGPALMRVGGQMYEFELNVPGDHIATNAVAAAVAMERCGVPLRTVLDAFAEFETPDGRGRALHLDGITVLDESYNANPASMAAALRTLEVYARESYPHRIAVLGDMLELGEQSKSLHEALVEPIEDAKVDIVFACGPMMKHFYNALPEPIKSESHWAETAIELEAPLLAAVRGGDVVMIKGSNGMKLSALVEALKKRHSAAVSGASR